MRDIWKKLNYFSPGEFDTITQEGIGEDVLLGLDKFRHILYCPVYPSPAEGAGTRDWKGYGYSWHYSIPGRNNYYSSAIDVFIDGPLLTAAMIAIAMPEFGGVGIYPHWKWGEKCVFGGLHLDTRPVNAGGIKSIWWRDRTKRYHYLLSDCAYGSNFLNLAKDIVAGEVH